MKKNEPEKPKGGFKLRWHLSAIVGAVLAVLLFNSLREQPAAVPVDADHRPLLTRLTQGATVEEIARECLTCHNPQKTPLPKDHPANEKCLACHPVPTGI